MKKAQIPSLFLLPLTFFIILTCGSVRADVALPALFSDHAVLQRSPKTPVWGTAEPGEAVSVSLGDAQASAITGSDGKWRACLDLSKSGDGPFILGVVGKNALQVQDVVVGEVWLASGQSNMEFRLRSEAHAAAEIPRSADWGLRQFTVSRSAAGAPVDACKGKWIIAGPDTAGGFTAVGYYFAKELRRTLHVPVGLLTSAWGGTPVESWTSDEALATVPALHDKAAQLVAQAATYPGLQQAYVDALHAWQDKYRRQLPPPPGDGPPQAAEVAPGEWKPVPVPGKFISAGLPDSGVVWLRRTVFLTASDIASGVGISLAGVGGTETVYWNGKKIGGGTPEEPPPDDHRYYVPSAAMHVGDNIVAIRIANSVSGLALNKAPRLGHPNGTDLIDGWSAQTEFSLPAATAAMAECPKPPAVPTVAWNRGSTLYNGMIAPLIPYAIAGAIWYQGEDNAGRGFQYRISFPLMIHDWRKRWGFNFPFYFCQLPGYGGKAAGPGESAWADLRESQARALSLSNTGMAVLIDAGEEADVHPKDKLTPGGRLARIALVKSYGQPVTCPGPVFQGADVEGNKIRVSFAEGSGPLVAAPLPADYAPSSLLPEKRTSMPRHVPDGEVEGFAICGADRKWTWADAKIDGITVLVWSPQVPQPIAVRYAWANNPTCNLANEAGLPAAPFRSDAFPLGTEKASW